MISIIIPCRNEEQFISTCLDSIIANDYPKDRLEVLVIDGLSNDDTKNIVADYVRKHEFINLVDNPRHITSSAINIGIETAGGAFIILMGAHTKYPADYISKLVSWAAKTNAAVVGGICITQAANDKALSRAIAIGLSNPFGVGNSHFRIGVNKPRWVDTVAFGCYRREIFAQLGKFDEELVRNQDDEFNLRVIKRGGRILLVPDVVYYYYARDSVAKVWRMCYQYGYFKPLVARKVGGIMTLRQIIPAVFVLTLLSTAAAGWWSPLTGKFFSAILLSYAGADLGVSAWVARKQGIKCGLFLCLVFPVLHFSYGLGFLKGLWDFVLFRKKRPKETDSEGLPLSR